MTDQHRGRIAVINDDTTFLSLMAELLTMEGFDVKICREGDRAYDFVKQERPDLVVLDIRMGSQETGWTILECLTLDPRTRPIPVIVCSAAITDLQAHQLVLDQYGVDVLPKPFDIDKLLEKVENGLARAGRSAGE